jgi:hypothetical protein
MVIEFLNEDNKPIKADLLSGRGSLLLLTFNSKIYIADLKEFVLH